jgi:poly(hydroxyalkanoate) depolymerase family esterase
MERQWEQIMKHSVLDVMGDALNLVRQSDLAGATAIIRKALSGEETGSRSRVPKAWSQPPSAGVLAPPPRRPLGEVLRALRDRPAMPPGAPPELHPAHDFGERFLKRVYRGPTGSLGYRLYLPADRERRDLALVLMLHGCTQNPEDFALGTQMNGLADEFGLIVAYPHQPRRANASGCWNWFDPRHQNRGSGEPARLAGLAQALAKEFGIGPERIFAAGLSAGGAMAEVLAATYPDVFAAVGVHSGLPYRSAVDVPSAFAAMKGAAAREPAPAAAGDRRCRKIIIHGLADGTVDPVNGERILDQAGPGERLARIDFDSQTGDERVSCTVLEDADGRPLVEHWQVEGGGHAWFGGDPRGSYTQTVGLDASRVMVRFFLRR